MEDKELMILILIGALIVALTLVVIIIAVYFFMRFKNAHNNKLESSEKEKNKSNTKQKKESLGGNKQSIHQFMEFNDIDDNMIIQNKGKRFLMIIECQGVNYDLMSGVEKTGVEQAFIQFLNTLRNPIQIYIQTRSVNLEESIATYKERVDKIYDKLNVMRIQYNQMIEDGTYTKQQLDRAYFELTKQTNLYEYGKDIIYNTENMSLNKNILNQKYYIILPYYAEELGLNNLDAEETKNLVFSELYTRAQSTIRAISSCGVKGKILQSNQLVELLYMAYNRDEAEVFGIEKAIRAGYNELYSTAPDVISKRMKEIDKYIREEAEKKAREKVEEVLTEKEQALKEKEESIDDYVDFIAKAIIGQNEKYIGTDVKEEAIKKIDNEKKSKDEKKIRTTKEGGKANETRTRVRRSKTTN